MRFIIRWVLNALALMGIAYYIVPGLSVENYYSALMAAFALGLVNALIRPVILLLTLPLNIVTLGLFTFVINALLFWFVSSFIKGFVVADFAAAFWGALCLSVASWVIHIFFGRKR